MICCHGSAHEAMSVMRGMMQKLKLTVDEEKTRICRVPEESFDFLGYTIGRCYSSRTGRSYIGTRPPKAKVTRLCRDISKLTSREWTWLDEDEQVGRLNRMMVGWANYVCLGPVTKAYRNVNHHARHRLRQWLCCKHKLGSSQGVLLQLKME